MPDQELQVRGEQQLAREQETVPATTMMAMIAAAAKDPTMDVAKMADLMAMYERLEAKSAEKAFNRAMQSAQEEMRPVYRNALNQSNNSRYADLETIDAAIRPIYTKHGFAMTFNSPATAESGVTVSCTVLHSEGHSKDYQLSGALDVLGAKGAPTKTQIMGLGSSVSYLQRYLTRMIFNIVLTNQDDDGQTADPLTDEEYIDIDEKLKILQLTPDMHKKFLSWAGASSVATIQRVNYQKVRAELSRRVEKMEMAR